MAELKLLSRVLPVWLPIIVAATVLTLLVFAALQQNLRMGANDPQVQMAEDAAARLNAGAGPDSVTPAQQVDMARSLAPFLIVFGHDGRPLASSALLDGQTPLPPRGVFDSIPQGGRSEITWAPRPDVREAAVIVAYRNGDILAGRSLRLVEQRADALARAVIVLWLVMLISSGLAILLGGRLARWLAPRPLVYDDSAH